MLILARVYRFFRCSAIWTTGPLYILTAAAHHYLCMWASHPEHNVGVWQQVCQFLQCLVLMVLNNSLKTSPLSPLDVFFPLPSPPHPSCILRSHLLLSSLSFLYPPFFVLLHDLLLLRVKFWGRLMMFKPDSALPFAHFFPSSSVH